VNVAFATVEEVRRKSYGLRTASEQLITQIETRNIQMANYYCIDDFLASETVRNCSLAMC
jgi:hypothetical protein